MNNSDLVFSMDEDKIMSAGFNINSLLLKEQIDKSLDNYLVPVGLAYKKTNEVKNDLNYSSNVIDSDIYDKLVEFATTGKKKKIVSKKNKQNNNKKTHKQK